MSLIMHIKKLSGRGRAVALTCALALSVLLPCACTTPFTRTFSETGSAPSVRFSYVNARAGRVCLAGSFNEWSPDSACMTRTGDTWIVSLPLPPGRYAYVFVVDGRDWKDDPEALLSEDSGFGMKNSIVIVE